MPWLESLIAIVILVALIVSWSLWTGTFLQWRSGKHVLPAEARRPAPWGVGDLIGALATLIATQITAWEVLRRTTNLVPSTRLEELSNEGRVAVVLIGALSSLAALGVGLLLAKLRAGATWRDLGVSLRDAPFDFVLGLAGYFMLAPIVLLVMLTLVRWFPSEHPLVTFVKANPDPKFFVLSTISAVLVAPIVEEFLFRVMLQGWLEAVAPHIERAIWQFVMVLRNGIAAIGTHLGLRSEPVVTSQDAEQPPSAPIPETPAGGNPYAALIDTALPMPEKAAPPPADANPYAAPSAFAAEDSIQAELSTSRGKDFVARPPSFWPIFVSASVFALLHFGHGPDPIPLFVLAVGLGYLYRQTHRVLPCIVVHMLLNAVSMLVLLLSVYAGIGNK